MKNIIAAFIASICLTGIVQAAPVKNTLICVPQSYDELPVGVSYQVRVAKVSGVTTSYQLSVFVAPVVPNAKLTLRYTSGARKTSKGMLTRYTALDENAYLNVSMIQNKTTGTYRGEVSSPVLKTKLICRTK